MNDIKNQFETVFPPLILSKALIFSGKTFENCWKTDLNSTEGNLWELANPLPTAVAFAGNFALMDVRIKYIPSE